MSRRTVLINASYAPSLTNFRGPLIAAIVRAGHRVHTSAPGFSDALAEEVRALGATPHDAPVARTGLNPFDDLRYYRSLKRLIRKTGADLVLGYTVKPCVWGSLAARAERIESASLITGLGYAFIKGSGARHKLVSQFTRHLYRAATTANRIVIFQNPDDRADFIAAGALADPGKARLVDGSGVDMGRFPLVALPAAARFLMIARLLGNKGVREYGESAVRLLRAGTAAHFSLAGYFDAGPDAITRPELDEWIAAGLEYLGPLDDVRPALADASVYVLPSYREGTPRTVLEAMAMGRPVITTDAAGCRETVIQEQTGLLVPARDAEATAQAMLVLAGDGERRAAMGAAGHALCARKYAVDRVNATMLDHLGLTA